MDFGVTQLRVAELQQMQVAGPEDLEGEWPAASFVRQVMLLLEEPDFQERTLRLDEQHIALFCDFDWTSEFTLKDLQRITSVFNRANRHTGLVLADIQFAGPGRRPLTAMVQTVILRLPEQVYSASV